MEGFACIADLELGLIDLVDWHEVLRKKGRYNKFCCLEGVFFFISM